MNECAVYNASVNILFYSVIADVDECELGTDICNGNAFCTNNIGLYQCSCMEGYKGDGYDCRGKSIFIVTLSKCRSLCSNVITPVKERVTSPDEALCVPWRKKDW